MRDLIIMSDDGFRKLVSDLTNTELAWLLQNMHKMIPTNTTYDNCALRLDIERIRRECGIP
jgi:hypothetical protein